MEIDELSEIVKNCIKGTKIVATVENDIFYCPLDHGVCDYQIVFDREGKIKYCSRYLTAKENGSNLQG